MKDTVNSIMGPDRLALVDSHRAEWSSTNTTHFRWKKVSF